MNIWISVNDKLPPDNEFVLVYVYGQIKVYFYAVSDDGQERCHWWEDEGGSFHSDIADDDVTHWMPLPQPPTRRMAVLTVPHYNS